MDPDRLETYDYPLPTELIAQEPLPRRDASRLLVVRRNDATISHRSIRDLPELLQPGDCLVLNNSRVLPARLFGIRTKTGGKWEGLFLSVADSWNWRLIGQTRGYLRPGETVTIRALNANAGQPDLILQMIDREEDGVWRMEPNLSGSPVELLPMYGIVPLPPYIERSATEMDRDRYQTTYATRPGSVAAPTAGLHLTPELLQQCRQHGVSTAEVTLHVGVGTFRPVSVDDLSQHIMHAEWCEISAETACRLTEVRSRGGRIVAVGTTSARTLEAAYAHSGWNGWTGETKLFIRPPYELQAVDALLTNFHLPKSTLLMLVSAFASIELIQRSYAAAIAERYRFFSYGDAMLIL
jgi:S-adenosylmethionine:tRNA ribosyltransferase-isomerase